MPVLDAHVNDDLDRSTGPARADEITGPAGAPPVRAAERISAGLGRLFRVGARMKADMATARFHGLDLPGLVALHRLAEEGPRRAGGLAERLHMDPSQLSRVVATLVRQQLVERRADPLDGRATQLVATDRGREVAARYAVARTDQIHSVVADWDPADATAFAAGLERFVTGVETTVPSRGSACEAPAGGHDHVAPAPSTTRPDGAAGTDHRHVQVGATP